MSTATLPQLSGDRLFLTDGGLETCLIFHQGVELPEFAAIDLMRRAGGREELEKYFEPFIQVARENATGLILDTPTWRASRDWAGPLGYREDELRELNRASVEFAKSLRDRIEELDGPVLINGVIGPRGDGYVVANAMSADEATDYHSFQAELFRDGGVDMISAITMNYVEEAIGVTRAAQAVGLPVVISFTVETDGRLPSGQALSDAIEEVDAQTGSGPAYYMINCAHPTHFEAVVKVGGDWRERIVGLRANASKMSHAELDEADELDEGDPRELAQEHVALREHLPRLTVLGGCCGTDARHVGEIARSWLS
jgi:S-methylmethionine-dependent homocysteine/selenocysteine methylase